jgi:hypothetical protein
MKKILICVVIFFIGFVSCLILIHGPLEQASATEDDVLKKLNDIIAGQQEVVAAVNSMKEDIQIIKVRVTQLQ